MGAANVAPPTRLCQTGLIMGQSPKRKFVLRQIALGRIATLPIEALAGFGFSETEDVLRRLLEIESRISELRQAVVERLGASVAVAATADERRVLLTLKRAAARAATPLSPERPELTTLNEALRGREELQAAFIKAYGAEEAGFSRKLARLLDSQLVVEGLMTSSASLLAASERYVGGAGKRARQFERSFFEHLARCCAKTSPRGILTATQLVIPDPEASSLLSPKGPPSREPISRSRSQLGLDVVRRVIGSVFEANPELWRHVCPTLNPMVRTADLPRTPLLDAILERVAAREGTAEKLLSELEGRFPEHDRGELEAYYLKLGELGLLRTRFEIPFSASNGLGSFVSWLKGLPAEAAARSSSLEVEALLASAGRMDAIPISDSAARRAVLRELVEQVRGLTGVEFERARVLVTDSVSRWGEMTLGAPGRAQARELVEILSGLMEGMSWQESLDRLHRAIRDRFPGRERVCALELNQHPELVRDGFAAPGGSPRAEYQNPALKERAQRVAQWLRQDGRMRQSEVRIGREEWDRLIQAETSAPCREKGSRRGTLVVHPERDPKTHQARLVLQEWMPGGASLLARWSPLFELQPVLEAEARDMAAGHPPIAQVILRTNARNDAANFGNSPHPLQIEAGNALSDAPRERRVALEEVFLRVTESELSFVWCRDGRETPIVPLYDGLLVDSSPLMAVVQFLAGSRFTLPEFRLLSFLTGSPEERPGHLPRLVVGEVVLTRETWVFDRAAVLALWSRDGATTFLNLNRWRAENGLPRFFFHYQAEGTRLRKPGLVDSLNPALIDAFFSALRQSQDAELWLQEMLPSPESMAVSDSSGHYANELMIPCGIC
jgi:hypothetical protein